MKIVVVSVERAVERRRQVTAGLEKLGLDFDLHDAVDWRDLTPEQKASVDVAGCRRDGQELLWGSVAACLSQRAVLADLVENGPGIVAMLEDDVTFSPEFPSVLNALEETDEPFDIVFLHRGPHTRRFVSNARLSTGHELGWRRWSHHGAQGVVITREAARRFLLANPLVRPGLDRDFARYWHHGLTTYCLWPAVVHHLADEAGYRSLVWEAPPVRPPSPLGNRIRRLWFYAREGTRKRLAFCKLAIGARGPIGGSREILGFSPTRSVENILN